MRVHLDRRPRLLDPSLVGARCARSTSVATGRRWTQFYFSSTPSLV